jgi:hypothetical protein
VDLFDDQIGRHGLILGKFEWCANDGRLEAGGSAQVFDRATRCAFAICLQFHMSRKSIPWMVATAI